MPILVTFVTSDGRTEKLSLPIRKSSMAAALREMAEDGERGITMNDLISLDSGNLSLAKALAVLSPAEVRAALQSKMASIGREITTIESLQKSVQAARDDGQRGNTHTGIGSAWDRAMGDGLAREAGFPRPGVTRKEEHDDEGNSTDPGTTTILSGKRVDAKGGVTRRTAQDREGGSTRSNIRGFAGNASWEVSSDGGMWRAIVKVGEVERHNKHYSDRGNAIAAAKVKADQFSR